VKEILHELLESAQSKIEVGTVVSVLVGTATYVGNFFYKSYFDFYFIDSADITIPLADSVRTFIVILVAAGLLLAMVATAERHAQQTFGTVLVDNIPLFVLLLLLSAWAINIYWDNVESLSEWLAGALKDNKLREENAQLTPTITHFLKHSLFIAPPAIAAAATLLLSWKKFSFSKFVLAQSIKRRFLLLCIFVLLTLNMARVAGHLIAFLEFSGITAKSEIAITLTDGKAFHEDQVLYLVTKSAGIFYVAARSGQTDHSVRTWQVAQPSIRYIEFRPPKSNAAPFFDSLK
jgi:hypothetical protein